MRVLCRIDAISYILRGTTFFEIDCVSFLSTSMVVVGKLRAVALVAIEMDLPCRTNSAKDTILT